MFRKMKGNWSFITILTVFSCVLTANSAWTGPSDGRPSGASTITGRGPTRNCSDCLTFRESYNNPIFGYSVIIPDNLVGVGAVPEAPDHGIRIDLDDDADSYVSVEAEYNALDFTTAKQIADLQVNGLKNFGGASKIKIKRESTMLCNLPAVRQTVEYEDSVSGTPGINYGVFTLRPREKYGDIAYDVTLSTSPSGLNEAMPLFLQVLRSFKCTAPKG